MTGRTHDLAAFTALVLVVAAQPLEPMTFPTVLVAIGANMLGGLAPDLDQTTSEAWQRVRGGSVIGRLIAPLLGGHRFISHSLLGVFLFGFILKQILNAMSVFLLVDMEVIWWSFMIGFVSHLITDTMTKEGVPWLFPIPFRIGIPPLRFMRVKTGGIAEKSFVFPGLLFVTGIIFYLNYTKFLDFLRNYLK